MPSKASLSPAVQDALRPWHDAATLARVRVVRGSFFGWLFALNGNHAVTINGTVHVTRHAPPEGTPAWTALMAHELYHVEQQAAQGWWPFLLRYLRAYRPRHLRDARSHPLEAPAYARGREALARAGGRGVDKGTFEGMMEESR